MGLIDRMRKQQAVYWAYAGTNEFNEKQVATAVQIRVRWEDVNEEFLDVSGETRMSKALVYVGEDIVPGSILMLGVLADITDTVNIKENAGAWEVRRFDKLPDLKAKEFLRTCYL
jgi:hypothetical protein